MAFLLQRVEQIVQAHDPSKPLFMYMAFQNVHGPIQAPEKYIEKYNFIKDKTRRVHAAMADIMDEAVGNITDAFKSAGLVQAISFWYLIFFFKTWNTFNYFYCHLNKTLYKNYQLNKALRVLLGVMGSQAVAWTDPRALFVSHFLYNSATQAKLSKAHGRRSKM